MCAMGGRQKGHVFRPWTLVHSLRLSVFLPSLVVCIFCRRRRPVERAARAPPNCSTQGARERWQMPPAHLRNGRGKTSASIDTHTAANCTGSQIAVYVPLAEYGYLCGASAYVIDWLLCVDSVKIGARDRSDRRRRGKNARAPKQNLPQKGCSRFTRNQT